MKKTLSILLSFLMIVSVLTALPLTAHATTKGQYFWSNSNSTTGYTLYFDLNGDEAIITDCVINYGHDISIPSRVHKNNESTYYDVVRIGEAAFQENEAIESVTIAASVAHISDFAFNFCSNLSSVTFENGSGLKTIGEAAFGSTAISSIAMPKSSLLYIYSNAFEYCENLNSITIPDSVKYVCSGAFYNCSALTEVTIGSKVERIGYEIGSGNPDFAPGVFSGCTALSSISVKSSNENFSSASGVLYNKDKTTILFYPQGKVSTGFELRASTTTIADYAFEGNLYLKQIIIDESSSALTTIGNGAFRNCSGLNNIANIPDSLTSIGEEAFKGVADNLYVKSNCNHPLVASKIIQGVSTRTWDKVHGEYDDGTVTTPSTCKTNGVISYKCTKCNQVMDTSPAPLSGHTPAAAVKENVVPATCTEAGSFDSVAYCSVCGKELSREKLNSAALGHSYKNTVTAATGTKCGYTTHTCIRCNVSFVDSYTAPTDKLTAKCKARTVQAQTITWNNVKSATGYQVQISTKDGKKWSTYATLKAGVTNYTFKKLAAGNNYKFRVRFYIKAADGKNYFSPWSATLNSPTLPSGTTLTKLTGAKKAFTAQWKKQAVTGYQVQYSTKSNFSGAKKVTVKNVKTLKATVKKLSAKKTYYVRIRTYKTISKVNYFSTWSKTYKVKTK